MKIYCRSFADNETDPQVKVLYCTRSICIIAVSHAKLVVR